MTSLPGWHSDPCLGDKVADLADGRLAPADAESAFAHVASCDRCRLALEAERAGSAMLSAASDPEPSDSFLARLLGIPADEAAREQREESERLRHEVAAAFPPVVPAQAGTRPAGAAGTRPAAAAVSLRPSRPSRRRRARVAVGSAAGAAALAVVAVVVGGAAAVGGSAPAGSPSVAPVVDVLTDEHAVTIERLPFSGPKVVTAAFAGVGSGSSSAP